MQTLRDEPAVFLITGPLGAGKSTVAALLAARFAKGVHLEGDVFRRSVISGRLEMTPAPTDDMLAQLRLRYRLSATVTDGYFNEGFTVVLEDVAAGPLLAEWVECVRSRPLNVIVLMPSLETVIARDGARPITGYGTWSATQLYDAFLSDTPRIGAWLDTTTHTPQDTVDEILSRSRR